MSYLDDEAAKLNDVLTHVVTTPSGIRSRFLNPAREPQAGDVYVVNKSFRTLAKVEYEKGDLLEILEKTSDSSNGWVCSTGNCRVKCKHFVTTWSSIPGMIAEEIITLKDST